MLTESQRAALAARLRRGRDPGAAAGRITRRPPGLDPLPASAGQEQLWFLDRFAPGQATYNVPCPIRLTGPLDTGALRRAVDALAERHEALRTRLAAGPDGRPVQVIDPPRASPSPSATPSPFITGLLDYGQDGQESAWQRLRELAAGQMRRPFDLSGEPLLRSFLVRLAAAEHVLLIVVHHAVFDGWSGGVLVRDVAALYAAEVTGQPPELAELRVQFADYAVWEHGRLAGDVLAGLEDYWRGVLAGCDVLRLPTDRPRPSVNSFAGGQVDRVFRAGLLAGLEELSRRERSTLFVTLLAGLAVVLSRWSGQDDVMIGTTSANRDRGVLAPVIGFIVNTLPIRADLSGDPTFAEFLGRVRAATVAGYAHQELPFGRLVEALGGERDASRAPLVQVMFNLVEAEETGGLTAAGVRFEPAERLGEVSASKFDLSLFAFSGEAELRVGVAYATALFDPATVQRLLANLEVLLAAAVAEPGTPVSRLPLLTDAERHRELTQWNDTTALPESGCLHQGFEAQAARAPSAVAAQFDGERISYAELNDRASRAAGWLTAAGTGPEVLTGVCMQPGLDRLAVLLGILKAGGGYVPLDPELPAARLSFMAGDAGLALVVADAAGESALGGVLDGSGGVLDGSGGVRLVPAGELWPEGTQTTRPPGRGVTARNLAYVIYTSGSTGQPKGVMVEHRQAVAFARAMIEVFGLGPADATLGFASLGFDVSVMDMFLPLLSGGRVEIVPPDVRRSPSRLAELINSAAVTYACLTPSVLGLLAGYELGSLRYLVSGGEELSGELAAAWQRPGQGPALYNTYGPTEAAVVTTWTPLPGGGPVPPAIGRPLPGYLAYILDARLSPVPLGVTGELYIGGPGVARGYLARHALTASRFVADPFGPVPGDPAGGRLYRSGDLVRRRTDGSIVFCGRADQQVKVRGLRIELGEIEAALEACPGIARAVVTVVTDTAGDKQLAGYAQPAPGAEADPGQVRKQLATVLPAALIPAYLTVLAELPLNASGKVSRDALPRPAALSQDSAGLAEPATATEAALAGLYATVLGRERVGATDSFFEIGGSSLQVMRLVDLIGRELGTEVGVATVFLHPTPRKLAASIDAAAGGGQQAGQGPLMLLSQDSLSQDSPSQDSPSQDAGEPPLFLIHAVGGTVFAYAGLASELAGPLRVYGIEAPGLSQDDPTASSLGALADDYAGRIRTAQPDGPYRLGGWSMGGVIAFEVARRLEQAGQRVSLLVLMDAPFTQPDTAALTEAQLAGQFLADATNSLGWEAAALPDPGRCDAAGQLAWLADRLRAGDARNAGNVRDEAGLDVVGHQAGDPPDPVAAQLERRFAVFLAHIRMLAGYRPSAPPVAAPVLIISAGDSPNAPAAGHWPAVLGGQVESLRLPGDHYAFLRPPLVGEVGRAIRDLAGRSRGGSQGETGGTGGTDQMELRPTAEEERAHVDRVRAGGAGRATSRQQAEERFRAHPAPSGRDHGPAAVLRPGAAVVCGPVRPWHADLQHHVRPAADRPAGAGSPEPGGRCADHAP